MTAPLTTQSTPGPYDWLASVLPDADQLSHVLGYNVSTDGAPPFVGGIGLLRDTVIDIQKVTESQCLGVVSPLGKRAFGTAAVRAVTYGTESTITFGAVAFATAEEARALFATFVNQWEQCDGKTLVDSSGTTTFENRITEVKATDEVISAAVLLRSNSPTGVPVRSERALGIAEDCIVEVVVPIADASTSPPRGTNSAVELVDVMLTKVRAARR